MDRVKCNNCKSDRRELRVVVKAEIISDDISAKVDLQFCDKGCLATYLHKAAYELGYRPYDG